jgi:hypothetical protein
MAWRLLITVCGFFIKDWKITSSACINIVYKALSDEANDKSVFSGSIFWIPFRSNSYLCTYDLYGAYVMFLMRADPLRGQVGGG